MVLFLAKGATLEVTLPLLLEGTLPNHLQLGLTMMGLDIYYNYYEYIKSIKITVI